MKKMFFALLAFSLTACAFAAEAKPVKGNCGFVRANPAHAAAWSALTSVNLIPSADFGVSGCVAVTLQDDSLAASMAAAERLDKALVSAGAKASDEDAVKKLAAVLSMGVTAKKIGDVIAGLYTF